MKSFEPFEVGEIIRDSIEAGIQEVIYLKSKLVKNRSRNSKYLLQN